MFWTSLRVPRGDGPNGTWTIPKARTSAASIGQLSVVYVVNRQSRHLSVLDIVWLG
jgi:hypothetical protein